MAKEDNKRQAAINTVSKGMFMDCSPSQQPEQTRRYTLNAVEKTVDGVKVLSAEPSTVVCSTIPEGYSLVGSVYMGDNTTGVLLVHSSGKVQIGIIDKDDTYTAAVETNNITLDANKRCDIIFRLRQSAERTIYWTNGTNPVGTFNFDREYDYYNNAYKFYLKSGGYPNNYIGEKWNTAAFALIKTHKKFPIFAKAEMVETGNVASGSYNFAIQQVDANMNPTAWITTSGTVNVFNDSVTNTYGKIRGSRNISSSTQNFNRSNKSIRLTIANLDTDYPYYRVAIIRAASGNKEVDKVLVSDIQSINTPIFTYNGDDGQLAVTSLSDIVIEREVIATAEHIEQIENRCILASTKKKDINWCSYQKFASKIKTDLVTKETLLNNIESAGNIKNINSTFTTGGYMPGEVVSIGIVYLMKDYSLSPVFHIPGKSATNTTSQMKVYELDVQSYIDTHSCSGTDYWGRDSEGQLLVGRRVRHHRFPFRSEVNKPLVTTNGTNVSINKYKLTLKIELNPSHTPAPAYPVDGDSNPIAIPYNFTYTLSGAGSGIDFTGYLTKSIIDDKVEITIYDDTTALQSSGGGKYAVLDPTSVLGTTYQTGTNDTFIITETYTAYTVTSSTDNDRTEIFGLKFSEIERPSEDVIGFFIVKNEVTEDNKLIVDNAIAGPTTKFGQYVSFGLLTPKKFYSQSNCGRSGNPGANSLQIDDKTIWVFSPEHQFLGKNLLYDEIRVEGLYTQVSVNMPTISNKDGFECNGGDINYMSPTDGGTKGVLIQDVQAGTSYDPSKHKNKDKDDDGFDLVVGYKNTNIQYTLRDDIVLPLKESHTALMAAASKSENGKIYYNSSVDNKIILHTFKTAYTTSLLADRGGTNENALFHVVLVKNNGNAYANFETIPYYKEHNNPILFGTADIVNGVEVFNGEARVSATNIVSSVFYDMVTATRSKKSGLWKIILGAALVTIGVILAAPSGGASLGLSALGAEVIATLSTLALSIGVSLASSGITTEGLKRMIQTDYEKGLKKAVFDGGMFATIRDTIGKEDDTIRWFSDRVSNLYIESAIPIGLRSGLTSGITDFTNSPISYDEEEFRSYLIEKFTVLDRDQGSGRLYKGYAGAEIYDINLDYMRINKEKIFFHLPNTYDCCNTKEEYPLRRWYSEQSFQEEKLDNYGVFLPNSYSDMEGEHGKITDLFRLGDSLFIHTEEGLWHQPANLQERITGDVVSFIGTGEFFSIPPRKILDTTLGAGGTKSKWATVKISTGVIFYSETERKLYSFNGKNINNITIGIENEMDVEGGFFLRKQLYDTFRVHYSMDSPQAQNGIGFVAGYDYDFDRYLFTKSDFVVLPDKIGSLVIVSFRPTENDDIFRFNTSDNKFYLGKTALELTNPEYFENKSFTLSFSVASNSYVSWHSYLPVHYVERRKGVISIKRGSNNIYLHSKHEKEYGNLHGVQRDFIVETVLLSSGILENKFEEIFIDSVARKWQEESKQFVDVPDVTFDKIIIYNDTQLSREKTIVVRNIEPSPSMWYSKQIVARDNEVLAARRDKMWCINTLRDEVKVNSEQSIFTKNWTDIYSKYPIDKVINAAAIDANKNWSKLGVFTGKFIIVRLIFSNFNKINLYLNYVGSTEIITD